MDEPAAVPPASENRKQPAAARGWRRWVKVTLVVGGLGAAVGWLLFGSEASEAFVYSKLVSEVTENPAAFANKELRVEGELRQGSIRFREDPCEWQFVLEKSGHSMPVSFPECVVPDTFRDGLGISVTVQGRIQANGSFVASQVIPRCPSKYDPSHATKSGEAAPHASSGPLPARP